MKKRLLSLLLALTLCVSLTVPALADVSGSWGSIYWLMDSSPAGADDLLELGGSGTLSGVKGHVDPSLEEWDLMDLTNQGQFAYFDVTDGITGIADGALEGYTSVKGVRIAATVTKIGDLFGSTLSGLSKPVIIYGVPGSAAEKLVERTNEKEPGTLLFADSSVCQIGEDPRIPADACGENIKWSYEHETSTLAIGGTGSTWDFEINDRRAWNGINGLPEHVVIEEGVTRIGNRAFTGNSSLKSVSLPSTLTAIGAYAFIDSALPEITLPANLTALEDGAFSGCRELKEISIPGGITRIGNSVFERSGLTSIRIPASVTYICDQAFWRCDSLTDVYYEGSAEDWARINIDVSKNLYQDTSTPDGILTTLNIHYNSYTPEMPTTPPEPEQAGHDEPVFNIMPTTSTVLVNGTNVAFDAYNINGANYFKLRDLAFALNGSAGQFEVTWDAEANCIALTSGKSYTAVGGELATGAAGIESFQPTSSAILLDGTEIALEAFNINGSNYFKLRDLGAAFNFGVDWDGTSNTVVIDTAKGYA